jgi:hypothetical protein
MSMSLTYFSSLNMLKQMREINSDTTSSAVSATAEAAAAAAAASAAANIPGVKGMKMGAGDIVEAAIETKQKELEAAEQAQKDAVTAKEVPFPKDVRYVDSSIPGGSVQGGEDRASEAIAKKSEDRASEGSAIKARPPYKDCRPRLAPPP